MAVAPTASPTLINASGPLPAITFPAPARPIWFPLEAKDPYGVIDIAHQTRAVSGQADVVVDDGVACRTVLDDDTLQVISGDHVRRTADHPDEVAHRRPVGRTKKRLQPDSSVCIPQVGRAAGIQPDVVPFDLSVVGIGGQSECRIRRCR